MRVLITRPTDLALPLAQKAEALGMEVELFPVIEIRPTPLQAALNLSIQTLDTFEIAIWISQHAVQYSMPLIHTHFKTLPPLIWAAIGPGTAEALLQRGIPHVRYPADPPYNSEALLAMEPFQNVKNKKILIFRGNGGRELLREALTERGAWVQTVETYQRCLPDTNVVERLRRWRHTSIDVVISVSGESLQNFVQLLGEDISWLKNIPLVVVGARMHTLASQFGFANILLADSASDAAILTILKNVKETRL